MTDIDTLDDRYCPRCGEPVAAAQAVAVTTDDAIDELFAGSYSDDHGHVVVNGGEIRLYRHEVTS